MNWPNTTIPKSMDNAFTLHLREPRSIFRGEPGFRAPTPGQFGAKPQEREGAVLKDRWGSPYLKAGEGGA